MKTQILFFAFAFETTTKDGAIIGTGIRIEQQIITRDMMDAKFPLLSGASLFHNGVSDDLIKALKGVATSNL